MRVGPPIDEGDADGGQLGIGVGRAEQDGLGALGAGLVGRRRLVHPVVGADAEPVRPVGSKMCWRAILSAELRVIPIAEHSSA